MRATHSSVAATNPFRGCRVRSGMESQFFVEAKSFIFSVVKGYVDLRVVGKRNGFSACVMLGVCCVAWLLSMVEEVL